MAEYFMSTVLLRVTCPGLSADLIARLAHVEKTSLSSVRISYGLKCDACHLDVVARRYPTCLSTFQPLFCHEDTSKLLAPSFTSVARGDICLVFQIS